MAIVEFKLDDGSSVYMEVEDKLAGSAPSINPDTEGLAGIKEDTLRVASQTLDSAMSRIKSVGNSIIQKAQDMNQPADEVEVKFGIKMSADLGAIVAKTSGEVNYEITLKWDNKEKNKQKFQEQQAEKNQQS